MPTTQAAPNPAPSAEEPKAAPITIKKYANRRLYNTATSSYVTLENLAQMVKDGAEFLVFDAKSGEDITRSVLTQIIVEEEGKGGQNMLPIGFLRQLIALYGDNLQFMVPRYLESSMEAFARNQDQMRTYFKDVSGVFPFGAFEEMSKQNMALFERAMQMFTPFAVPGTGPGAGGKAPGQPAQPASAEAAAAPETGSLDTLRQRLDDLQRQLDAINKPKR
ncbi:polyhydroxyalkanoate synthesis repressor PhaR [Inquilinus ginsengisoli]|jgi:polyhydroxyalkanoate synthesis repressor PhaR|uniref:Polyhydroxyalkanoate synthesis repressor PhaR n=1 Tax=Inquilinus ginsengisoli TaxID=363840 RepID=A0ABU1JG40_9PROT|nr:polyhydroxyalkanoate synthesis repressor PhaR [Inquilinus ginsengisoli]MDR6287589.1 polyhydroxyalkanoate synthesis repressor PhaR [Inquilinus ginsengisoli]